MKHAALALCMVLLAPGMGARALAQASRAAAPASVAAAASNGSRAAPGFDQRAVWTGNAPSCQGATDAASARQCLLAHLRAGGASPAAMAFAERLAATGQPGWMTHLRTFAGTRVVLATAFYPFRANTNEGTLLINGAPPLIDVDVYALSDADKKRPAYRAFARRRRAAQLFAPASFLGQRETPGGGARFVFGMAFKQCHACAVQGQARIAYDFDAAGKLVHSGLIAARAH